MSEVKLIDECVNSRVKDALKKALSLYLTRLKTGMIDEGLEASFQMHLAGLLKDELELLTIYSDERFSVELEKKIEKAKKKNYIDIVVKYEKKEINKEYFIELKFKKKYQAAENQAVVQCFEDIYNLENSKCESGFFIFLTDYELYTKKPSKKDSTRNNFPMHDKAEIKTTEKYKDDSKTSKNLLENKGLEFKNNYKINYNKIKTKNKNYWFFLLEIKGK